MSTYAARETWLSNAVDQMRPWFTDIGEPLPARVRVAVGFGPQGARQENSTVTGVTLSRACSADGVNEVWVSPECVDAVAMLNTLIHELVHVALDNDGGHGKRFADAGRALGFVGRMTSSEPSPALAAALSWLAGELGPYPGARVDLTGALGEGTAAASSGPKRQKNQHGKLVCPTEDDTLDCYGYAVRITGKWLKIGLPACPNGHEMMEEMRTDDET